MSTNIIPGISRNAQNICRPIEEWVLENPILLPGQIGIVEDIPNKPFKFGDGKTHWNDLKFSNQYPNYLISYPGTRDGKLLAGTLFTVPEYTVYDYGSQPDTVNGQLRVTIDGARCVPRKWGDTISKLEYGDMNHMYGNAFDLVGNVGEKSTTIKFNMDIAENSIIEVHWIPPTE